MTLGAGEPDLISASLGAVARAQRGRAAVAMSSSVRGAKFMLSRLLGASPDLVSVPALDLSRSGDRMCHRGVVSGVCPNEQVVDVAESLPYQNPRE